MENKLITDEMIVEACKNSLTMAQAAAKLELHYNTFCKWAKKLGVYKPNQGGKGCTAEREYKKIPLDKILEGKHPEYQTFKLKNRLIKDGYKENVCDECGLKEWRGKPLNMELHHIDGKRTNHRWENLKFLCPNCHAQTDTYRAKNIT